MKRQTGFTLIELMIGITVGLIVLAATVSIYMTTVMSNSYIVKSARINHDLESVMNIMISDIRRAGYWGLARARTDGRDNPFNLQTPADATTDLEIPNANCILYTYDANSDGTVDANEYYGFKLVNGALYMRISGATTDSTDCSDGTWEEFVYSDLITIASLNFSFLPAAAVSAASPLPAIAGLGATSGCFNSSQDSSGVFSGATGSATCTAALTNSAGTSVNTATGDTVLQKRLVNIQLGGYLADDTKVVKTIVGTVEVRNNRLYEQ